jgi:hypothetical protein
MLPVYPTPHPQRSLGPAHLGPSLADSARASLARRPPAQPPGAPCTYVQTKKRRSFTKKTLLKSLPGLSIAWTTIEN